MNISELETKEFILEVENSRLMLDRSNKIVYIVWQGIVELDTAQQILMAGSNYIEDGSANLIILNRKELDKFSKEASKWIKDDLLKTRAKELVHNVKKVATIGSRTTIGNLFSNIVTTAIRIVFPGLKMKSFESAGEADAWLLA